MSVRTEPSAGPSRSRTHWRTVDIVVASAIAVAFGVIFWAWGLLWNAIQPAFVAFPPAQGFMYGVWLLPGVLAALVIRKPGAAIYAELIASVVEALLGSSWGLTTLWYGVLEGAAPELVFAVLLYRRWGLPTSISAGAAAGVMAGVLDLIVYYATWSPPRMLVYVVLVAVSSAAVAGIGGTALVRSLGRAGALNPFPSAGG